MTPQTSLGTRFIKVIIPTKGQAIICLLISLVVLAVVNVMQLFTLLGLDHSAVSAAISQYHDQFSIILTSKLASSTALVTFWATVGLVAYLVCWSAYNVLIEARNEVTLETQYTNRGHWHGPYETMGLKAVSAIGLVGSLIIFRPGFAYWANLSAQIFTTQTASAALQAVLAVAGLAAQFYLVLTMIIITFTPWYRKEAFTEQI